MAEAVVEVPTRYYCHMCREEINIPNSDYTCPICAGGFVEELTGEAALTSPGGAASSSNAASTSASPTGSRAPNQSQSLRYGGRYNDLDALRGEITTLLLSRNGPNLEIAMDPSNRRRQIVTFTGGNGGGGSGGSNGGSSTSGNNVNNESSPSGANTAGGRVHPAHYDRFDNVLLDFLQSISGGGLSGDLPFGPPQMFFMGNPGDYAWGREGLDTIVTQLLNQMETAGPPPMAPQKIAEIPTVPVTAEDVEKKLQCSVCWEDFQLEESVRRLPCSHIYHENCIVPWLNLHGTCPICRKSLVEEGDNTAQTSTMGAGNDPENERVQGGGPGGNLMNNTTMMGHAQQSQNHQAQQQQPSQNPNIFTFEAIEDPELD